MKIITIGREQGNTIVINDGYVGRRHLEIIQDDHGHFILRDLNSTNGTYVNGKRVNGEIHLRRNDIVRIGNATLPWRDYFEEPDDTVIEDPSIKKQKVKRTRKPINWRSILTVVTSIISLLLMIFALLRYLK